MAISEEEAIEEHFGKVNNLRRDCTRDHRLSIAGWVVTMDAMGTQTHNAQTLIEARADYILSNTKPLSGSFCLRSDWQVAPQTPLNHLFTIFRQSQADLSILGKEATIFT
jgi:hypothetical protein